MKIRCDGQTFDAGPQLERVFRAVMGSGYRGRRFSVVVRTGPLSCTDTYWDGGSRSEYMFYRLADGQRFDLPDLISGGYSRFAPLALDAYGAIPMPAGVVCVQTGVFCGKDRGVRLLLRPEDARTLLPAHLAPASGVVTETLTAAPAVLALGA